MTEDRIEQAGDSLLMKLRILGWSLVALVMVAPVMAMASGVEGVDWGPEDFIAAAILLGGAGLLVEMLVRISHDWNYRIGSVLVVFATLFMIWSNLAVGIVGSEDNGFNAWYFLLLPILAIGATVVRLRPQGMASLTRIAAIYFIGMGIAAFASAQEGTGAVPFVIGIHAMFVTLYFIAALLFGRAARARIA